MEDAIKSRKSTRVFSDKPVTKQILQRLLESIRWAPSWGNTQPWQLAVVSGQRLDRLRNANLACLNQGLPPQPEMPMPQQWPAKYKARYQAAGKAVLDSMNIERSDGDARATYYQHMYRYFEAPVLLLFLLDSHLSPEYSMLDLGMMVQSAALSCESHGLGSCMMAIAAYYPQAVRTVIDLPKDTRIVLGMAVGYPNETAPLNNLPRQREQMAQLTHWY